LFTANNAQIIALAVRHRLPASYQNSVFTTNGGLLSYGSGPDWKIVAIQPTFLTRRGCKAVGAVPRIAIGALGAGAVRFGKPEDVLGLAERIETALSA
jgi:hypothetical protein